MQIKINKIFGKSKSLPLDLFLEKVLYDKNFGYYQKKNPFGKKGDFITAPNISNIFCEMVVIWLVSFWESLNKPKKINIVELGPGNGD
ncbi:SAM-dependent methyltransferase, partial [Pelagibacteraceae bacterium]|nr:SAM-dependent methyltransferase [Pelagibacteraceae bacterium]